MENEYYYNDLPIGEENAISYEELCERWGKNKRAIRMILHELSLYDNGDNYILIRSSKNKGFYKTDEPKELKLYKKECLSKGRSNFAPVKKINRILNTTEDLQGSIFNNLKNVRISKRLSQAEVCKLMWEYDVTFDVPMLSKLENGAFLPTPFQLLKLAKIYGVEPSELVMVDLSAMNIYTQI